MRRGFLWLGLFASLAWGQPEPLQVDRLPFTLGGTWWFRVGHDPAWSSPFREKTHWQAIQVPKAWEKQGFRGYNGHAWYRIVFQLPARYAYETLGVDLGMLGDVDEVFLNGQKIGSSGSFPPSYEPATLQRRIYPLPQSKLRFGEFNELAVHVYNDGRFGGFLGPVPKIDTLHRLVLEKTGRDVVLWVSATALLVLACFHLLLLVFSRADRGSWAWGGFLLSLACYLLTYAAWGPRLFWSSGTVFRLNVGALLLTVGFFVPTVALIFTQPIPTSSLVFTTVTVVGAGFAMVWRRTTDLYLWVYLAELAMAVIVVATLRKLWRWRQSRPREFWPLLLLSVPFVASLLADAAVDLGWWPRPSLPGMVLYSCLGVIPFAFGVSFVLVARWSQQHAAGLLPPLGLLPFARFVEEIQRRLLSARSSRFAVAFLRLTTPTGTAVEVESVVDEIRRQVRHCDVLSRFSRETLALLLEGVDEKEAVAHLERLRRALRQIPGRLQVRLTAGVAASRPVRFSSTDELLKAAEAALYAARSEGGDCVATAP